VGLEPAVHALRQDGARALVERVADDVAAHHHRQVLADEVGEVDERRPRAGQARQHQHLRPVVLHVLVDVQQLLHARQCPLVRLRLRRRAPVHVCNNKKERTISVSQSYPSTQCSVVIA